MQFLFGWYIVIPNKKTGHNHKGTTWESPGMAGRDFDAFQNLWAAIELCLLGKLSAGGVAQIRGQKEHINTK